MGSTRPLFYKRNMARKKVNVYYELVRKYRELPSGTIRGSEEEEHEVYISDEVREEVLGLYCSRGTSQNEKDIWKEIKKS